MFTTLLAVLITASVCGFVVLLEIREDERRDKAKKEECNKFDIFLDNFKRREREEKEKEK